MHPQRIEGESLTSWFSRQANANLIPIRTFLLSYLGQGEWRRKDLDLVDGDNLALLAFLGSVEGAEATLRDMTLSCWLSTVGPKNKADQKSWISNIWTTRFCPLCLSHDPHPFLRRLWRLRFLPVCSEHGVLLQTSCWKCSRTPSLLRFFSEDRSLACEACGSSFCESPAIRPKNCENLLGFASRIEEVLDCKQPPLPESDCTAPEFFSILKVLVRYFSHSQAGEYSWNELLRTHGLSQGSQTEWMRVEAVACVLVDESLRTMQEWPNLTVSLIRNKLAWFENDFRHLDTIMR